MNTNKDRSLLQDLINYLNQNEATAIEEIVESIGWKENSLWGYIYLLENTGFLFRYGYRIILRKKIPPYSYKEFSILKDTDDPTYFNERLDRLKETALTPKFMQSLTFLECLYLLQKFGMKLITTQEFSKRTGKTQRSAGTIFKRLVNSGYLSKEGLEYTILKDIPVVPVQAEFLRKIEHPKLDIAKKIKERVEPKEERAEKLVQDLGYTPRDKDYDLFVNFIQSSIEWGKK